MPSGVITKVPVVAGSSAAGGEFVKGSVGPLALLGGDVSDDDDASVTR